MCGTTHAAATTDESLETSCSEIPRLWLFCHNLLDSLGPALHCKESATSGITGSHDVPTLFGMVLESLQEVLSQDHGDTACPVLAAVFDGDLPMELLSSMRVVGFESRKQAARIFDTIARLAVQQKKDDCMATYVSQCKGMPQLLLQQLESEELSIHCTDILLSLTRSATVVSSLLEAGVAFALIRLLLHPNFDVASCACKCLQSLLLLQRDAAAAYLEEHFLEFFNAFHSLLLVDNYVTRRQALGLLGELLLHPSATTIMLRYVASPTCLKIHMNLLLDPSKMIKVGAFHIFKLFVANPQKSRPVQCILWKNRERLMGLLRALPQLNEGDAAFHEDVTCVFQLVAALSSRERSVSKGPCRAKGLMGSGAEQGAALLVR